MGVAETASANEIKSAYRRLSLKYHPDRPGGDEENFKKRKHTKQHTRKRNTRNLLQSAAFADRG